MADYQTVPYFCDIMVTYDVKDEHRKQFIGSASHTEYCEGTEWVVGI